MSRGLVVPPLALALAAARAAAGADMAVCESNRDWHWGDAIQQTPFWMMPKTQMYEDCLTSDPSWGGYTRVASAQDSAAGWSGWFGSTVSDYDKDYFVFHGCDGSGIQPDCVGDTMYFEHFMKVNIANDEYSCDWWSDNQTPDKEANHNVNHQYCHFWHPGFETNYLEYHCGVWSGLDRVPDWFLGPTDPADLNFASQSRLQDMPNPYIGRGDVQVTFMGYLAPWTCHQDAAPDLDLFVPDGNGKINCYCDNEPWNTRQEIEHGGETARLNGNLKIYFCGLYWQDGKDVIYCVGYGAAWQDPDGQAFSDWPQSFMDRADIPEFHMWMCHDGDWGPGEACPKA